MKVCTFVADDCGKYKIAVRKLARTLAEAGHDVRVIAILNKETEPYEESDGARIFRVALNPIPRKILRLLRLPAKMAPKLSYLVRLLLQKLFPRSFEAVMQGTADSGLQQRGVKNFIRGKYDFARRALRENPAYFLTVGWLLGAGFVLLGLIGLPFWWLYNLWYRFTRRLILRLSYRYLSYLDYYYRSYRLARQEPADVYHAHDLVTLPVAWLCSRLTGGKLVYDSHELWLDYPGRQRSRFNRFIVQRIESFLIRRTDANIAPGESVGQELSRRYHMVPTVILNVPYYRPFQRSTVFRDELGIPAVAEPWRNGMVEHFNDHYQQKFLRKVVMASVEDLRRGSLMFEQRHNSKYRYSKLKGHTPLRALSASNTKLRFPKEDEPPKHRLDKPQIGKYHVVRLIRSDLKLDIFGECFPVPPEAMLEYVVATIDVKKQKLKLFLGKIQVEEFDYKLR